MYQSLQTARAIAALMVVLFHLGLTLSLPKYFGMPELAVPFSFGDAGVEFFFVLSGFIIFSAHRADVSRPERLFSYASKRAIRIYPVYWIVFLAVFLLARLSPSLRATVPDDVLTVVRALLLIPADKHAVGGTGAPVLTVAWTLQYEAVFYVAFGAVIVSRALGIVLLLALVMLHLMAEPEPSFPLSFFLSDHLWLFLMGVATALISSRRKGGAVLTQRIAGLGLVLFAVLALDTVLGFGHLTRQGTLLYGFAFSLIVFSLVKAEQDGSRSFANRHFLLMGDASYALYLIHLPLISILCKLAMALHLDKLGVSGAVLAFVVMFPTCVAASLALHLWIERPMTAWLRNRSGLSPPGQS